MKFKFRGIPVEIVDGRLKCDDEHTTILLSPMIGCGDGAPEKGDPFLNMVNSIYGRDSVTDIELSEDEQRLIH